MTNMDDISTIRDYRHIAASPAPDAQFAVFAHIDFEIFAEADMAIFWKREVAVIASVKEYIRISRLAVDSVQVFFQRFNAIGLAAEFTLRPLGKFL